MTSRTKILLMVFVGAAVGLGTLAAQAQKKSALAYPANDKLAFLPVPEPDLLRGRDAPTAKDHAKEIGCPTTNPVLMNHFKSSCLSRPQSSPARPCG